MIPEIGVIVGLYVITRMLQLATDEATAVTVKVFGVITALVTAGVIGRGNPAVRRPLSLLRSRPGPRVSPGRLQALGWRRRPSSGVG